MLLIIAFGIVFTGCTKEEHAIELVNNKSVDISDQITVEPQSSKGWVMQTWNFNVWDLSEVFSVGDQGLVVSGSNSSSSVVTVYIQQRDASNNALISNYFIMQAYGTGMFSTATPETGIDNVLITVVRNSGGLTPKGSITVNSKY